MSDDGADNITRQSKGPLAGCAARTEHGCGSAFGLTPRDVEARVPESGLGLSANAVARRNAGGRLPGGKPCDREGHARFGKGALETGEQVHGFRKWAPGAETTGTCAWDLPADSHRASALLHVCPAKL